jgi:pectate lyase
MKSRGSFVNQSISNSEASSANYLITYHNNWWLNINSQTPSLHSGSAHIFSSCFENVPISGIDISEQGKALIENNHFYNVHQAVTTDIDAVNQGFATERNNIFDNSSTTISQTGHVSPTYGYG